LVETGGVAGGRPAMSRRPEAWSRLLADGGRLLRAGVVTTREVHAQGLDAHVMLTPGSPERRIGGRDARI
ncbi:MAG TPA: hypothetical protein PLN93_08140, partial [Vicinamibacterales bacterium]|nr:hypothetical protein [Vicinamibacterales bacterium]HPK71896.1 hypothetical protein [Vicinamibacterales bacterium]